jgi:hypothetical protein
MSCADLGGVGRGRTTIRIYSKIYIGEMNQDSDG